MLFALCVFLWPIASGLFSCFVLLPLYYISCYLSGIVIINLGNKELVVLLFIGARLEYCLLWFLVYLLLLLGVIGRLRSVIGTVPDRLN